MFNRTILLLTASIGIIGANSLVLSPIAAGVARSLGQGSAADVMVAAALYGLGVAGSALFLAPRADRIGADRALMQALLVLTLSLLISALAPSVTVLTVAQIVAGVGAGMAIPAIYTLAAQIAPQGREAQTMGAVLTGWMLSMVGGVTLSAYIAEWFGWRVVYLLLAAGAMLLVALVRRSDFGTATTRGRATSPLTALKVRGLFGALFSVAMIGTGFYGIYNYLGAHLEVNLGRPVSDSGLLTLVYGLGFGLSVLLDPYLDRVGPRRGLAITYALFTVLYAGFAIYAGSYLALVLFVFFWGVLQHIGLTLVVGRLTALDPCQRGAIMGLNSTVMYLSVFSATLLFRPLFDAYGLWGSMMAAAGLAVLGAGEAILARQSALRTSPSGA